jgi:uncharacterized membrane protein (DUF441 family)
LTGRLRNSGRYSRAALVKLTPLIALGFLAWKALLSWIAHRRHRATPDVAPSSQPRWFWASTAAGMALGLTLLTVVIPPAVLGWERNADVHRGFYDSMVAPYAQVESLPEKYAVEGYSLKALLVRYLTDSPTTNTKGLPPYSAHFATWSPHTVWRLYVGIALAMVAFSLWSWRGAPRAQEPLQRAVYLLILEMGVLVSLMVSISPVSRRGHFVVLIIPVMAALRSGFLPYPLDSKALRRVLLLAAIAVGVISLGSSRGIVGTAVQPSFVAHTVLFWPAFLMWLACASTLTLIRRGLESSDSERTVSCAP